jgi:acyl-CoA reductase-like NAD-dependent aldehyde dehydrogenase
MGSLATLPRHPTTASTLRALERAREAASVWSGRTVAERLPVVREFRHLVAERADDLARLVGESRVRSFGETLSAEVLPLADACRFLEREARGLLAPRRLGRRGRPFWLAGTRTEIRREPLGVVLIVAPSNYPLFIPGVQMAQAITAGNAVLVKPGRGGRQTAEMLRDLIEAAGAPEGLVAVLDESPGAATAAIDAGVDKVVLTGSSQTGRAVTGRLAPSVTPAILELSGCDAVFVREDADLDLVTAGLRFGLTLNGGATCIGPRRVFVPREIAPDLENRLVGALASAPAVSLDRSTTDRLRAVVDEALAGGARLASGDPVLEGEIKPLVLAGVTPAMRIAREDIFAPILSVIPVDDDEHALALAGECPFELGATVFGRGAEARALAARVAAGTVVINDVIVPTADPRAPFGGWRASGHGVTRGAEGLLELTRVKTVIERRGTFRPHFEPVGPREEEIVSTFVQVAHARSLWGRLRAVGRIFRTLTARSRNKTAGPVR